MAATFSEIMVEKLSANELTALSAYDLGRAMNEVIEQVGVARRELAGARKISINAKIRQMRATSDDDLMSAKEERAIADGMMQDIRDRASALRTYASILQSLLKAATII